MKSLEYYMELPYRMEIIPDEEGGYVASYPDLPGCLTCGETVEETVINALDAKKVWLEAAIADGVAICEPSVLSGSGEVRLSIPKNLHDKMAKNARTAGLSVAQYCVDILSNSILPQHT